MDSVALMSPRGVVHVVTELYENSPHYPPGKVKCCACPWWMDARALPENVWQWRAATHDCTKPWPGYSRYSIKPTRVKGYRTA